ncbi:MAG: GGDEF domain-containing protein [Desulfuromonadales bacterium]|nr:GGDEF domain-containing protein [Desulfuromonadales bacterium]
MDNLISINCRLPSPPSICIKILDLVRKDDFTFQQLANVINSDPSLAAKLLKVANTCHYSHSGQVNTVAKAVAVLGANAVKIIALSFVIYAECIEGSNDAFNTDLFWRRSLTAAVAAEQIATSLTGSSGDLFLIALLQDIGSIFMSNWRPHDWRQISKTTFISRIPQEKLEQETFGFDHSVLAAGLFKSWNFPEELYLPIQFHHSGELAPLQYRKIIDILEVSNLLSAFYNGNNEVMQLRRVKQILTNNMGMDKNTTDDLIESVAHKSREMFLAFEISDGNLKPLSQILQEANEELVSLLDSYELVILELKQAKELSDSLARELHESNERHKEMAYKDELTQIYNFRYFHEALDREVERVNRYGRELSVILFDLDDLKKINDTYGHIVGSQMLINISKIVQLNLRGADVLARLGGDEFGIILPESGHSGALLVAEQIRCSVEALEEIAPATLSIGVSSYHPGKVVLDKATIMKKADDALYRAKNNGKNRVCFK